MFGLPKNERIFCSRTMWLLRRRPRGIRVLDSYYNAFIRHLIDDQSLIGHYLERELCINGKTRSWKIRVWNDYYMDRDGLQVWEKEGDESDRLIVDLSNWELKYMWKECAN